MKVREHTLIIISLGIAFLSIFFVGSLTVQAEEQRANDNSLIQAGFDYGPQETIAQEIINGRAENDLKECVAETGNTTSGGSSGGDYVPVHEVGELLSLTTGINKKVTHGNDLLVDICMHLKAIRRVQYVMEAQVLYHDPNARKAAAKAIFEHKQSFIENNIKKGYEVSPALLGTSGTESSSENKQPLYVANMDEHLKSVRSEAYGVFDADLTTLNSSANPNIFTDSIRKNLAVSEAAGESEESRLRTSLGSTITKDEFNAFTNDFSQGGWDMWLKVLDPRNNYRGSKILAQDELNYRKSLAETNAREEIASAKGFLPVRECATENWVTTADGKKYCRKWTVKTPGTINESYLADIVGSTLRQNEIADQSVEDFSKTEFARVESELTNLEKVGKTEDRVAVQSIFQKEDPCPGPGPCEDSGWVGSSAGGGIGGGGGITNPTTLAQQIYNNKNTLPGLPDGLQSIFNIPGLSQEAIIKQITEWLKKDTNGNGTPDYLESEPPKIVFTAETNSLAIAADADRNTTKLTWNAWNATECSAVNDWLSASTITKSRDTKLAPTGTLTVRHPYTFTVSLSRSPDLSGWSTGRVTSVADQFLLSQKTTIDLSGLTAASGLSFTLSLGTNANLTVVGNSSNQNLTQSFKEAYNTLSQTDVNYSALRGKYAFTFDISNKKIYISANPIYKISCTNANSTEYKDVTITR